MSRLRRAMCVALIGSIGMAPLAGCENLPGEPGTQGAVIGGLGGAAAGAAIGGEDNRLMGALIGGLLGAGGGYLIGANVDKFDDDDEVVRQQAQDAVTEAQQSPATVDDVFAATTADLNNDGFITLDEVVAMERAGLSDQQMLSRLRATNQVFDLTNSQEQYLIDRGVSRYVVNQMRDINREARDQLLGGNIINQ